MAARRPPPPPGGVQNYGLSGLPLNHRHPIPQQRNTPVKGPVTPARNQPVVQHAFNGEPAILSNTLERRAEIRKLLTALTADLMKLEGRPTQIEADIKFRTSGEGAHEHTYTVRVTDTEFDVVQFDRDVMQRERKDRPTMTSVEVARQSGAAASPGAPSGRQSGMVRKTPRAEAARAEVARADDDLEITEARPQKRQRTEDDSAADDPDPKAVLKKISTLVDQGSAGPTDELFTFLRDWNTQWVGQGGFLFDTLTAANNTIAQVGRTVGEHPAIMAKMDAMQDVLGQSINTSNATTHAELANVSTNMGQLFPWLEHCRKLSADKVQAREEKWRTSSATFHDQAKRERELAEARLDRKLDEQGALLLKLAKASGIDMDDGDSGESKGNREESLGAQLTAELNHEAERAGNSREDQSVIDVDDDE